MSKSSCLGSGCSLGSSHRYRTDHLSHRPAHSHAFQVHTCRQLRKAFEKRRIVINTPSSAELILVISICKYIFIWIQTRMFLLHVSTLLAVVGYTECVSGYQHHKINMVFQTLATLFCSCNIAKGTELPVTQIQNNYRKQFQRTNIWILRDYLALFQL